MLQSPSLEDHMNTIDIDQSLKNRPSVEHKLLDNIKIYPNMLVNVMTKKTSRLLLMML